MSRTLTFLFTDLEGSSALWERFADSMRPALARHDALLKEVVESHGGRVVKTTGDGLHAVFESASDGVVAALEGQLALAGEDWPAETGPLRVRMGLHTGETQERGGDYYGPAVNRAARIMAAGHGGQVLLSKATSALVEGSLPGDAYLLDLGEHGLRDLALPEHLFQLCHPGLTQDFPPLKSLSGYQHNLPLQLTSFVGRERELAEVKRLLSQTRLLTLLGPGGTGKTRLALQSAADLIDRYPDGVCYVELAPLTNPERLPERIASTLNVQEQSGRPMIDALTVYLRRKELLLLLDNVEHLVQACAEVAEHLLQNCPQVTLLVTGRESLFITGETTLQVPSLSMPRAGEETLEAVARSEAVQLFLARAQNVRPGFELTVENAPVLAEVVRRLDGIPLALELAAARLRMLSVEQIAARLNDRFRLLTGGRRTALPRQQTLQAMIDWSWNLLEEKESVLFRRLSVFSGGWTLEAAQAVTGDDILDEFEVFDCLEQLINKSLVVVDRLPGDEARYRMLESIRQYARDRLFEAGEGEALRDRHAEYYTAFGEQASRALEGRDMLAWIDRVFDEMDNFKAAREWALESSLDLSLRMAGFSDLVLRHSMRLTEARRWLEQVVDQARSVPEADRDQAYQQKLAAAVTLLGVATYFSGESVKARALIEEGIAFSRRAGAIEQQVYGLTMLLLLLFRLGDIEKARAVGEEALALSQSDGLEFLRVMTLGYFAPLLFSPGEQGQAQAYTEEAIRLSQQIGNPWSNAMALFLNGQREKYSQDWAGAEVSFRTAADKFEAVRDNVLFNGCLSEIGHMRREQGDTAGAVEMYRQTIIAFEEMGNLSAVAHQLESFAMLALAEGRRNRASRLFGAAQALRDTIHSNRLRDEQVEYEDALGKLAAELGEAERDRLVAEGRLMDMDQSIAYALG